MMCLALEFETAITRGIGEGFDFSVIEVTAAVEDHRADTGGQGTLGEELADLLGADHIGRHLLEGFVQGGSRAQGATLGVVDDLRVDMLVGVMDGEAWALRSADDFAADAVVNAPADVLAIDGAHRAVMGMGVRAAGVDYLPTLLPSLRRTYSPT